MNEDVRAINERVQKESAFVDDITTALQTVVIGQERMGERMLMALLTGGHLLLEGAPGLAKTRAVRTLCQTVSAKFQRLQFTPDLLPADVIGTVIYNQQRGEFSVKKGPIFANLILADEINRAPAKVQSALLEAMQEEQVTIGETTFPLEAPFMVLATQNPLEQEGTYPLPEAQLDRFMMHVHVGYPRADEEKAIMDVATREILSGHRTLNHVTAVVSPQQVLAARQHIAQIYVDDRVKDYMVQLVLATRAPKLFGVDSVTPLIAHGASPRATIALSVGARARAFLRHRGYVTPDDVKDIVYDVLRHRLVRSYEAEAEQIPADEIVRRILERIEVP